MLFAHDAAVATNAQEELQSLMDCFSQACKDFGLTISLRKTNVLGQDTEAPQVITIDDYELNAGYLFTYLGSTITDNLSSDAEIDKRIRKATFNSSSSHGSSVDKPQAVCEDKTLRSTMTVLPAHWCMAATHGMHMAGRSEGSTHST